MAERRLLALDVGNSRIGMAVALVAAKLPSPHSTITNDESSIKTIKDFIDNNEVVAVIIGLPRGLDGQETGQTKIVRRFAAKLKDNINQPVYLQDEALTSVNAKDELRDRKIQYNKGMVDALAATYILRDFLIERPTF